MNPFEFAITIIVIVFAFRLIAHRMGMDMGWRRRWDRNPQPLQDNRETVQLRDEVQQLKERIKVLERITVEKENSLAKEIESLRDR